MIGLDLAELISDALRSENRAPDGLLHPSGDLVGPLRHTQLRLAGAPYKENSIASAVRLKTGTFWHNWLGETLERKGVPVMREVRMNQHLPSGWGGTADFFFWNHEYGAFVLADLKTIKGEGIKWIDKDGMKDEHLWQLSAYYWAAVQSGMPIVDRLVVPYLPMNEDYKADEPLEISVQEAVPLPYEKVWGRMEERRQAVDTYLAEFTKTRTFGVETVGPEFWINDKLAPPMERVQKLMKNKEKWDVVLVPHWSAMFCPFNDSLCPCSTLGTTKVGQWVKHEAGAMNDHVTAAIGGWLYEPRAGYQSYEPEVAPKGVTL